MVPNASNAFKTIGLPVEPAVSTKFTNTHLVEEDIAEISKKFKLVNFDEGFVPSTNNIHSAARNNKVNDIYYFYQLGVDINLTRAGFFLTGITPLNEAASSNSVEAVELLLALGADVNLTNSVGTTPLCQAADRNYHEVAKALINSDVEIDFPCRKLKKTPLMLAARRSSFETAKVLLEAGASLELRSKEGKTAIQYTSLIMNGGVRRLIKDHKKERELLETQRVGR